MLTSAEQSLSEGNVRQALVELQEEIRSRPADVQKRIFLFQLFAILGNWQRALTQLNVIGDLDAGALAMVHTYREAIRCELLREQVFAGNTTPLVFGKPERWVALLLQALRLTAEGRFAESQPFRDEAFELAPATSGEVSQDRFEWIADADPRLGPVLEVVINGAYYWVPFDRIREIRTETPADLRDLVWLPAQFVWSNGGEAVGLIPVRYPGSQLSEDTAVQLSRKTEWQEVGTGIYFGMGQRVLSTDTNEHALLDTLQVSLDTSEQETTTSAANPGDSLTRSDNG